MIQRSKLMRIILVASAALILVGVLLWYLISDEDRLDMIDVSIDVGESETLEFESLSLIPGESCEYTVKLKKERTESFDLSLKFIEIEEKSLKNFARVKILAGEEVVCDELLATVFLNEAIVLPVDFKSDKYTELKIVYYLPIDVGNEAKNADAIFNLLLTASGK